MAGRGRACKIKTIPANRSLSLFPLKALNAFLLLSRLLARRDSSLIHPSIPPPLNDTRPTRFCLRADRICTSSGCDPPAGFPPSSRLLGATTPDRSDPDDPSESIIAAFFFWNVVTSLCAVTSLHKNTGPALGLPPPGASYPLTFARRTLFGPV
jgi:hypothetical protein